MLSRTQAKYLQNMLLGAPSNNCGALPLKQIGGSSGTQLN